MKKKINSQEDCKRHVEQFEIKSSGKMKLGSCLKEASGTKHLLNIKKRLIFV